MKQVPVVRTVASLRRAVARFRAAGETVALVPTMGALHEGHLSLVRRGRTRADRVVVSIFVNPTQFAPSEDFDTYPRTFASDRAALRECRADLIWAPASVAEMYPAGFATRVVPAGPAAVGLEDAFRPDFFSGVATVVTKLLLQCLPDVAIFGEKDFQQLRVVERIVADLNIPVRIVGAPTVREADGLAMSSRNVYLSEKERAAAATLYATLTGCARALREGVPVAEALARGRASIAKAGFALDYLEARHALTLERIENLGEGPIRLLVAARLGATRLIDNLAV
ncbi:MAG TPA: pantoate--beta-alanine ligase [Xanthobacteraceae bacterium]|nr:pantoate--beta-alanine ligase [Xanthobacteraceae bacterium]